MSVSKSVVCKAGHVEGSYDMEEQDILDRKIQMSEKKTNEREYICLEIRHE
jgi:hypothetical protein